MKCVGESFQLQMGFSFPFLRVNDLRTSLLIMRTRSLLYVGLFLNLIANAVKNNDQHVRSGTNVRISQNPHHRRKVLSTGIIIARRTRITSQPGQGRVARQLHRGLARKRLGRRRAAVGIYEDPRRQRRRRRRRKGGEEEEGLSRRRGGVGGGGGPDADHGLRGIHNLDRGAYDLLVGRGKAPVLRGARWSGSSGLPSREGGLLRAGQAGGGGCHKSGALNLLKMTLRGSSTVGRRPPTFPW